MGYKSPYNKVGQLKPEMKNQSKSSIAMKDSGIYMNDLSPLSMSPLNIPDPRKALEETAASASSKLENAADIKSGYGQTQEKTAITAPKQRKLDVGAYEQTYRESAKEVTGKDFGYMTNRNNASDAERIATGLTTANKQNIINQREQFQEQFGKGAQPNKPFIDATNVNLGNARTGKEFEAMKTKQQNLSKKRMESNILAEQTRQRLEQNPSTITTSGLADASSYTKPSMPTTDQSTKKKSNRQILGPKSFKNKSDYKKYKKSFKS